MKIFENKGTPLRLRLFSGGIPIVSLAPQYHDASALKIEKSTYAVSLHKRDSSIAHTISNDLPIDRVEILVLYPNGATWEGDLAPEFDLIDTVIWDPDYKDEEVDLSPLSQGPTWEDNSTSMVRGHDRFTAKCRFISHSCPDCDFAAKFVSPHGVAKTVS